MKKTVMEAVSRALGQMGLRPAPRVEVEVPREEAHGDLSTPVAMGLAKELRKPPREIARDIARALPGEEAFEKVEVAGPGFLNFTFRADFLRERLRELLREGPALLREDLGRGRRVQVEFVSANPTGPLHLGHGRGAAVGAALSNLLREAGFAVEREYYINDAGRQVELLGRSVLARYREALGVEAPFPEDGYKGAYVEDLARALQEEVGEVYRDSTFQECREKVVDFALAHMLTRIREDLQAFGVQFDTWQSERELYDEGAVEHALTVMRERGILYEAEGALWFRATRYGDEKDRVVVKSDGQHTYFASDIAYHLRKLERGFDELINVWGADHHGYVPRLEAVMEALAGERKKLRVLLVQMVALERGGKPVQMSKRAGEFVTLREVIDEIGADTAKFIFLTRRHDSHLTLDLEAAVAQSAENPVYYIQYATARIHSIFAHAGEQGVETESLESADLAPLAEAEELRLIKKLLTYPIVFEQAVRNREPHRMTFYLQELAGMFHPYYNRHRVVTEDVALTRARLALMKAIVLSFSEGLRILGVSAPKKM
ncbi:MAG: arginine--tRNA ligase [Nitrospirota bacterium]|jgi:arginyl-tRNA synthetase